MSENMKEKDNKECVVVPKHRNRADMLGQILLWVDKSKTVSISTPHRTYKRRQPKSISELYIQSAVTPFIVHLSASKR